MYSTVETITSFYISFLAMSGSLVHRAIRGTKLLFQRVLTQYLHMKKQSDTSFQVSFTLPWFPDILSPFHSLHLLLVACNCARFFKNLELTIRQICVFLWHPIWFPYWIKDYRDPAICRCPSTWICAECLKRSQAFSQFRYLHWNVITIYESTFSKFDVVLNFGGF